MAKYLALPNGDSLKVPDAMSYPEAMALAQQRFPELFAPTTPPPQGGFIPAVKSGFAGLKGDIAALAGRTGLMSIPAAEQYRKEQQEIAAKTFKPTEEGWTEAPLTKIKELAGQSLPYMAAPIAAGAAATFGAPIAGLGAVGAGLAGAGAGALASATQFTGSNLSRQVQEGKALKDTDLGAAALASIPQAALDTVSMRMVPGLGKLFGAAGLKLTEKEARTLAEQGLKKTLGEYALKTGKTAGIEGLTEASQQVFERMQAGLSLTDPDARKEYFDNFVGGAVLGGAMALPGHYMERGSALTEAKKIADEKLAAANKARQDAEEAEKSKPENLLKLHDDYEAAKAQMQQMASAIKKPAKDASDEEKAAYQQAKEAATVFKKETLKPLGEEYAARKGQLAPLLAERQRYGAMEAVAEQPTEGRIETPVQTLMAQHDALDQQTNALADQLQQAATVGDTQAHTALLGQYKELNAQKQHLAGLIEQQGGAAGFPTNRPPEEFRGLPGHVAALDKLEKSIESLGKKVAKAGEEGDFEAQNKHLAELAAAKTQQTALQQDVEKRRAEIVAQQAPIKQAQQEQYARERGQTLPLFSEQEAPIPGPDIEDVEGAAPIAGIAQTPAQARPLPKRPSRGAAVPATPDIFEHAAEQERQAQARATKEKVEATGFGETVPLFTEEEAPVPGADLEDVTPARWNTVKGERPTEVLEGRSPRREWAPDRKPAKVRQTPVELDLFSDANLIRTAIDNGELGLLGNIERVAQTQKLEDRAAERKRLLDALEKRLNLSGRKTTRTIFNDVNFYPTRKQGEDAYEAAVNKIQALKDSIEKKGKAKKSILQQALDAFAAREKYEKLLESGVMPLLTPEGKPNNVATWLRGIEKAHNRTEFEKLLVPKKVLVTEPGREPRLVKEKAPHLTPGEFTGVKPLPPLSMKDQVAALAAQKRGETELSRPLTKNEIRVIQAKFDAADKAYNALITGKIEPANKQMLEIYQKMHKVEELEPASVVTERKEAEVDRLGRSRRAVSEEAATAARINKGDVLKEAAASEAMQEVARKAGLESPAYRAAIEQFAKKLGATINAYSELEVGPNKRNDAKVDEANDQLDAIASREGVKTEVYKEALAKAVERLKEALSYSKQTPASRRTEQIVRKVTVEPTTMRTGTAESKEGKTSTKVKRGPTSAEISPERKPVIGKSPEVEAPAQEAKPRSPSTTPKTTAPEPTKTPRTPKAEETPEEAKARIEAELTKTKAALSIEYGKLEKVRAERKRLEEAEQKNKAALAEAEQQGRGAPAREFWRESVSAVLNAKAYEKAQLAKTTQAHLAYSTAVREAKENKIALPKAAVKLAETKPTAEVKPAAEPAAETKPVETKPVETTDEQRKVAEIVANSLGGTVVWQEGDLALIRGFARTGLPVYVGANKYSYTKVDIAEFKESSLPGARQVFTPETQKQLIDAKDKVEAEALAKHTSDPFVKFDKNGLALSEHIPEKIAGIIAGWKNLLGMDVNIYVGTLDDIRANKDKYTGPHRAIASSLVNSTEGSMRQMLDDSYYIAFTSRTSTTQMLEVLAHEMGHVHQREVFDKASTPTKDALTKAYEDWVTSVKGLDGKALIAAARSHQTSRYSGIPDKVSNDYRRYLTSFKEWYADNTAKWAMSSAKPQSIVEKFFSKLGAALRNFYKSLKGKGYLPNETFRQYMDKLVENTDVLPTPVGEEGAQQTLGGMEAEAMKMPDALTDMLQGERITSSSAAALVAEEPTLWAKVRAGNLGLRVRQATLDSWASIDEAVTKGVDKKVLSSLEGEQAMYYLRAGENRNAYVNQAITHGPLQLSVQNTPQGKSITFNSTKGATLMRVAELAGQAKLGNEATTEAYFTAYIAGQRAEKLGWEKLNTNPKVAKDAYAEVMGLLKTNAKAKDAFEAAAKEYKAYNNGLIDFAVQCGALSKKVGERLKETPYVPFYRVDNGNVILDLGGESIIRIGNIKQQPNLKDLVGSNRKIMPIYTSAIQNTAMLTEMALRNIRTKNTCFTLLKMGAIQRIGEGDGPEGAVRFRDNGVKKYAVVDTDVYGIPADMFVKSMEGIATSMPYLIRMMGVPTNWLRLAVTRMPAYAVRQAIRDPLTAWMTTGTDGVPVLSGMKELAKMVAGRSPEEERLMAAGAITSNVYTGDQQDLARFLRDMQSGKSGWEKLMSKADAFALKGDAATRVTVYKDSIDKGMTELQALMRAQESMNFSRHGLSPSVRMLSTLIPFFNAQLQGLDVLYRAMRGQMPHNERLEIQKKLFARGAMLTATTMAYVALMQDDEAYKKAKPEERYNNFFVRIPGFDEPIRVPIPFELGYLFKAIPEAIVDVAAHDESAGKALGGIGKLLWQSNPVSLPQAVKPLTEVVLNKSFYGGDIESAREQSLKPEERYRQGTTELAKLIGSVTGMVGLSPIKLDYLVRGYTGSAGIAAMSLLNPLLKEPAPGGKEVQEPTKPWSKNALIGSLFQPNDGRGILDEAYAQMKDIQQAQNTYKKKVDEGDIEGAREFAAKYADELALAKVSGAAYKQLGEWAKKERQITAAPNLTTEQKDALIKKLRIAENTYAERLLKTTRQMEERTTHQ